AAFAAQAPSAVQIRVGHDGHVAPVDLGGRVVIADDDPRLAFGFQAMRRGLAHFDRMWLRWRGPFGLVWKQAEIPMQARTAVLPDVSSARDEAIAFLQRDSSAEGQAQRRAGQGREFEAL